MMMNRRKFLRGTAAALAGAVAGLSAEGFMEAKWLHVNPVTLTVPRLPATFQGTRVAFLSDLHHGPYVPLDYVRHAVEMTRALAPDLILLGGDYPHRSTEYINPCVAELARLQAQLGVFAVLGNHDHYFGGASIVKAALRAARIPELTNRGTWVVKGADRFWLCGVGDYLRDVQNLPEALGPSTAGDAVILLSHNPDYVERIDTSRVGLVLAGHTHGGQVDVPFFGPPIVPSEFGRKYAHGLVRAPCTQIFISRGIGTITPPVRILCQPEIVLATLA